MLTHLSNALKLISDIRQHLKEDVLADADDCDYFRKRFKKPTPAPIVNVPVCVPVPERGSGGLARLPIGGEEASPPTPISTGRGHAHGHVHDWPALPEPIKPKPLSVGLKNLFSELAIIDEIPNDAIAKKISTRWKTKNQIAPITVLTYQENPEQKALLAQIAIALDVYYGPAKLLSSEGIEWDAFLSHADLKLVVICDYTLWQLAALMKFYKENPAAKTRQLGEKPLFLLPDLSLYLKDPMLKKSLWRALCNSLQSFSTKI